jgi:hypothetical protein
MCVVNTQLPAACICVRGVNLAAYCMPVLYTVDGVYVYLG